MKLSQLFLGAALLASASAWAQAPKYIFLYIGDGMGMGPVNTAQTYNRTILRADKPLTMMQMPVVGWCTTYSASADITDSAAAGTALSTGYKTKNGMLGQNPDSVAVESMALKLKRMGYGVGIATTVAADDATPGAFYAHVPAASTTPQSSTSSPLPTMNSSPVPASKASPTTTRATPSARPSLRAAVRLSAAPRESSKSTPTRFSSSTPTEPSTTTSATPSTPSPASSPPQ